jgi:hypothetical protein
VVVGALMIEKTLPMTEEQQFRENLAQCERMAKSVRDGVSARRGRSWLSAGVS